MNFFWMKMNWMKILCFILPLLSVQITWSQTTCPAISGQYLCSTDGLAIEMSISYSIDETSGVWSYGLQLGDPRSFTIGSRFNIIVDEKVHPHPIIKKMDYIATCYNDGNKAKYMKVARFAKDSETASIMEFSQPLTAVQLTISKGDFSIRELGADEVDIDGLNDGLMVDYNMDNLQRVQTKPTIPCVLN